MFETTTLDRVRAGLIGRDVTVNGPFGPRRLVYADYTASGRAVDLIEDAIRQQVLPWYANTHTESTVTGRRTTSLREQARQAVRSGIGGDESTAVIFCGSGATGAIDTMVTLLGLQRPRGGERPARPTPGRRPVVFVGPFEHHSNELSWRESIADVVTIPLDDDGGLCLRTLEQQLHRFRFRPLLIGSFSAASNVTGVLTDADRVSRLLHQYGALSFWDYAAAAPYVDVAMVPKPGGDPLAYKDAVFLSPHKFAGGPGAPGVLAVRRNLLQNKVPGIPGGGTVRFVTPSSHEYLDDPEHREEGGTPNIIGSIRAGLAFELRSRIGLDVIGDHELVHLRRALQAWGHHPNITLLGPRSEARLPILSFQIHSPTGNLLHHNVVVAMLEDLFGIQSRGGCSCAGPYGHRLLHITDRASRRLKRQIDQGADGLRPGWVRVGLSYLLTEEEVDLILQAVVLIAEHGWKLLPQYRFFPQTGTWRHRDSPPEQSVVLSELLVNTLTLPRQRSTEAFQPHVDAHSVDHVQHHRSDHWFPQVAGYLAALEPPSGAISAQVDPDFDGLRWFDLPSSCLMA